MKVADRDIDQSVRRRLHAYRTWRSEKTAGKRQEDYDRRCRVQAANIKVKEELAKARR